MRHSVWCNRRSCVCHRMPAPVPLPSSEKHCHCWRKDCGECGPRMSNGARPYDKGRRTWL